MRREHNLQARSGDPLDGTGPRRTTIYDVARLAGVSIKTVSRVANGQPNVRDVTRSRVQVVIDELGYRPDPHARYLGGRRRQLSPVPSGQAVEETAG